MRTGFQWRLCFSPAHIHHAAAAAADVSSASQISQSHEGDFQPGFICCPVPVMVISSASLKSNQSSRLSVSSLFLMRLSLIRVLWVHHASGIWVYPIMAHLSPVGLCVFLGVASLSMAPLYLLGETLSLMMWSSTGEGNLIIRVCYELHEAYFIIFSMHILVTL